MINNYRRREFIKATAMAGVGLGLSGTLSPLYAKNNVAADGKRVGIIGLDTSHVVGFTGILNDPSKAGSMFGGFKVVAAYPTKGSSDMSYSVGRLDRFTEGVKKYGVEIVDSEEELLKKVDVVLLESVDGRPHYEQALPVLKAGKRMFIDKPVSSSLADVIAIYDAAKKYNVPIFSSSATRFAPAARDMLEGKTMIGKILGADTYCPGGKAIGHPDMYFYSIHGIESLFTVMGPGCKKMERINTQGSDVLVGTWNDGRIGTFRQIPKGAKGVFGGTVFGSEGVAEIGDFAGYRPLLLQITEFFRTGKVPVSPDETLEIYTFMDAADESKAKGGASVDLEMVYQKAKQEAESVRL